MLKYVLSSRQVSLSYFGLSTSKFMDEWRDFMSEQSVLNAEVISVGDVNIHLDNSNGHYTQQFNQSLAATLFQQHIHEPTHHPIKQYCCRHE